MLCLGFHVIFFFLLVFLRNDQTATAFCKDDSECLNGGSCVSPLDFTEHPEVDSTCKCAPGFWGNECEKNCPFDCKNGGQCRLVKDEHGGIDQEFVCDCPQDFIGHLCAEKVGGEIEAEASISKSSSSNASDSIVIAVAAIASALVLLFGGYKLISGRVVNGNESIENKKEGEVAETKDSEIEISEPVSETESLPNIS